MKISKVQLLLICLVLIPFSALFSQIQQKDRDFLVSTDWLEENLTDSSLVVLHYGLKTGFDEEHIPGARYASIWDVLVNKENGLRHELPAEENLEKVLRSWGINNNSRIIICYQDGNAIPMASRLFYTLDYAGLGHQTAMLQGGLKAWKEEGKRVSRELSSFSEGKVDIKIKAEVRISKEEVFASLDDGNARLVDARTGERYSGMGEEDHSTRPGHIKGAVNLPFFEVTRQDSSHLFKTREELHRLFEDKKLPGGVALITYCGTGIWASPLYFTARMLGYSVRLYDASYQEWGTDDSLPID
ncbi:MAG: sulfurtransferase [Bacteroidales bacterium]|nr:sulfurtransferase [Bacteroidales bacterium]